MGALEYYRTPQMLGMKPFRCHNCGALMIRHFMGTCYEIGLECRRCKCEIYIRCKEPIPAAQDVKNMFDVSGSVDRFGEELKEAVNSF